jgi:hypothetical protein
VIVVTVNSQSRGRDAGGKKSTEDDHHHMKTAKRARNNEHKGRQAGRQAGGPQREYKPHD